MIDLDVKIELRDVQNGLRRMQLAGANLRPVFKAVRKALRADQRDHAKKRLAPQGVWPALASSTVAHRKQRHGKQGRKRTCPIRANVKPLGKLPAAFTITYDASAIRGISRVKWSGVHARGGRGGRKSKIPARDFLWPSRQLLEIISRKAVDYMVTSWDGKHR